MIKDLDLFTQLNNAVLDLQNAQLQTFERPLKDIARLLRHPDLEPFNKELTRDVDFSAFMAASERTGGGSMGTHQFLWPDDHRERLGLRLLLIEKLASDDPQKATSFCHFFFYTDNPKVIAGIHEMNRQLIIPFVRDYKAYVMNQGKVAPTLMMPTSNKVFIVHGHDDAALQGLARFLEKLGLEAIVLREQPDQGRTIIEKFEDSAKDVGFAVVVLTPDDLGGSVKLTEQQNRARQNVIFELGFFAGKLGRGRVCLLRKGHVEIPSDLFGVIYTDMDPAEGWKGRLVGELKAAKLQFDSNRLWG